MEISFFNETEIDFSKEIERAKEVLEYGLKKLHKEDCFFIVIIVNNDYIHKLNSEYRGIDRETDVITFALFDDKTFIPPVNLLGDIYISCDKVVEQAKEYKHSIMREFCFLAVHGMLHLLGYDHIKKEEEEVMFKLQEDILDEMGIKR